MAIPDSVVPVPEPLPYDQQHKILTADDKWSDEYALSVIRSDWAYAESYRINAHDWRYRNSDELYLAWAGQQYWEGTRVPRSSLGVYVVFEQIQAALSKLVPQVSNPDTYQFKVEGIANPETDLVLLAWKTLITKQLAETRFRSEVEQAVQCLLQHGNGVLEVGVEDYEEEYISFDKKIVPTEMTTMYHPVNGPVPVPSKTEERFTRKVQTDRKSRPYVRYVSVKDLYVDPNCESPDIQDAGYVIKRVYMRAEDVKALSKVKDFRIPDDRYLTQLSHAKSTANQDVTKLSAELFRYNMWNPSQDYTSDPSQKRIAVIEYTHKARKVWWLQGGDGTQSIIYNKPNRYGRINYFSASYADVLDRWHSLSVADVAEGEQRLQQAIINARVDELALALHPPIYKRRGVTVPWYQLKRAPGRVVETESVDDIKEAEIHNITQQAFVEVAASENRVQRITGLTDLAALGTPASGGNSANRTATGVNTQAGATQDRMRYIVENIEDDLIERVVNFVIYCDRKFLDVKSAANWLKLDPRFQQLDPLKVMNTRVYSECRASTKMAGKAALLQNWPLIIQTYMNPEFVNLMQQVHGVTLDPKSVEHTLWDSLTYSPQTPWFIPMSDQQKQQMQQPPPEAMMKAQLQQAQTQSDEAINQNNLKTKLINTLLEKGFDAHVAHSELDDKHNQKLMDLATQLEIAKQAKRSNGSGGTGKSNK